jgi:hypothetical protein
MADVARQIATHYNIPSNPSLGVVIGTFGTPGFVHLHLEAMKRYNPGVRVLVSDDASGRPEFEGLCREYGAEFVTNPRRLGHIPGDLSAMYNGLRWARSNGFDLLVKFSRRWLPHKEWTDDFKNLAVRTQHHTFSSKCSWSGFSFRSESLGMSAVAWHPFVYELEKVVQDAASPNWVEYWLHDRAINMQANFPAYQYESPAKGYVEWEAMFGNRSRKVNPPGVFWHNATRTEEYVALARSWGLPTDDNYFTYQLEQDKHDD